MTRLIVCLALVALLFSAIHVPQAQTFVSPILDHRYYIPVYAANYHPAKGIANSWWQHGEDCAAMGASWQYFYSPYVQPWPNCEGVPMIDKAASVSTLITGNFQWVMGFNEPDLNGLSPDVAAQLWRTIEAMYPTKSLVSPAPSHYHPEWLAQFRQAYIAQYGRAPRLDALAAHCYLTEPQCEMYVANVIQLANQWGVPQVWITEFAFDSVTDLQKFVAWMEANPKVARYAYFTNRGEGYYWPMALFDSNGMMTQYGEAYRRLQ